MKRFFLSNSTMHRVICFCGLLGVCCVNACLFSQPLQRYSFDHPQMGTTFRIVLFTANDSLASITAQQAFDRIDALNQSMSDYLPDSEINQLALKAGTNQYLPVSPDLWNVLVRAKQISRYSKGAFDVTIGPLTRLWRRAMRQQEMPQEMQILKAKALVGNKNLRLRKKEHSVMLAIADMKLDLGAIAKGYATEKAWEMLQDAGIPVSLVDGGGDIRLGDPPPGESGWKVEISDGAENTEVKNQTLFLANCGVATSGDTYRYVESGGKRYSHIIDPRTGYGISNRRLVTVIAPNGTDADALASAVSILGPEAGLKIARKLYKKQAITIYFKEIH
ncbi:MAG: FAD:protein FMN transferase [Bacteroidia bacterium]